MKIPFYIKIFAILGDGRWHNKAGFCRPYSQDDRRLREMKEKGWIDYIRRIIRKDGAVSYTEYRITQINESWWVYYRKHNIYRTTEQGQFVIA